MKKNKEQVISYDQEADVLALYMGKGGEEEYLEIAPNISVELNSEGSVIGIEILNASKVLKSFLQASRKSNTAYAR